MFSKLQINGGETLNEIRAVERMSKNPFSSMYGNKKYLLHSQHLEAIFNALKAVDKPLYKNLALSLESLEAHVE